MKLISKKALLLVGVPLLLISGCNNSETTDNEVSQSLETSENVTPRDPVVPGVNGTSKTNYTPLEDVSSYYVDIDMTKTGNELEQELHDLISVMTKVSYGDCRYMLVYTDEAIGYPGYVYSAYDGDLIPAKWDYGETWNREHTWPRSRMGGEKTDNSLISRTSDLHNIRASCVTANDSRSNYYFGSITTGNAFNPNITSGLNGEHRYVGDFRGDCARICFYMYVRYGRYDDECTLELNNNPTGSWTMGVLSTLLEWNIEDPVDAFETQRNNRIYEYQGNRNPFIDYPELADNLFI